jgi:DNA-binding XRE family transcriptional regulator
VNETSDFLDEIIAESMIEDPEFSTLVDAAVHRRELLRSFGRRREALGISQRTLAARMHTQQPAIARLERGESDPKLSTLERYAAALGFALDVTLVARPTGFWREPDSATDRAVSEGLSGAAEVAVSSTRK